MDAKAAGAGGAVEEVEGLEAWVSAGEWGIVSLYDVGVPRAVYGVSKW